MSNLISNFESFSFVVAGIVFLVYILIDGMYAHYTLAITKKNPMVAATTGALMHFLIAFGVLNYVQNYLYIIPLALGSWIGTYLVISKDLKSSM